MCNIRVIFTARRNATAMPIPSVCLSVCHTPVLCQNDCASWLIAASQQAARLLQRWSAGRCRPVQRRGWWVIPSHHIQSNHVLHRYLPGKTDVPYQLRTRSHRMNSCSLETLTIWKHSLKTYCPTGKLTVAESLLTGWKMRYIRVSKASQHTAVDFKAEKQDLRPAVSVFKLCHSEFLPRLLQSTAYKWSTRDQGCSGVWRWWWQRQSCQQFSGRDFCHSESANWTQWNSESGCHAVVSEQFSSTK